MGLTRKEVTTTLHISKTEDGEEEKKAFGGGGNDVLKRVYRGF